MYYSQQLSNSKHYLLEDFARTTRLYINVTIKPVERPARKKIAIPLASVHVQLVHAMHHAFFHDC